MIFSQKDSYAHFADKTRCGEQLVEDYLQEKYQL
jgi:hypothetical protein